MAGGSEGDRPDGVSLERLGLCGRCHRGCLGSRTGCSSLAFDKGRSSTASADKVRPGAGRKEGVGRDSYEVVKRREGGREGGMEGRKKGGKEGGKEGGGEGGGVMVIFLACNPLYFVGTEILFHCK